MNAAIVCSRKLNSLPNVVSVSAELVALRLCESTRWGQPVSDCVVEERKFKV
jgi:hypothetical protein